MAHTRLWSAIILGLMELGSIACSKSETATLTVQEPLVLDASGETLSLDASKVPIVASCANGQLVQKTNAGWACATPGPGGVPVTWDTITDKPATFPPAEHTHGFSTLTGVTASTEWPGTQSWARVTGTPDFALSSSVGAVTTRVSSVEGGLTTAQGRLTQVEGRVGALEAGGGSTSSLVMSVRPSDSALTGAGYSLVGLGRPESFTTRASIPSATSHVLGAAVLDTKVYVAGGYVSSSTCTPTANLWEYDLTTDKWKTRQQMSVARYGQVVVGFRGKVYSIGGYTCTGGTKVTEIYDPQLNTWTQGAPLPDHNHYAASYGILSDGKLHVVGGIDYTSTGTVSRSHVVYDFDTNTWSTARDLPAPRNWSASGVLPDGRLIMAGGYDGSSYRAETYLFDPAANSWTQVAPMPTALYVHPGAVIAGRFHTFTGHNGSSIVNSHYVYDPASDTWSSGAAVPFTGYAPSVAQLRGGALLVGGWTSSATTNVYEYLAPLYLYSK